MVTILDWPDRAARFDADSWWLTVSTKSPGAGLDGRRQVIFREMRTWANSVSITKLWADRPGLLRAFIDDLMGASGVFRLPVYNGLTYRYTGDLVAFFALFSLTSAEIASGLPFDDGTTWDDGAGWDLPETADPTVLADAPIGATRLMLDGFLGRNLAIGGVFTVNGFMYRVAENLDGAIRFNPPLREAITAGTIAEVNAPKIVVRLSQDTGGRLTLAPRNIGSMQAFDVEEAFQR